MGGNLWLVGSPGSEHGLAKSRTLEVCDYVRHSGEAFTPGGGEEGRAPTLHLRPRHLPYN